MTTEIIDAPRTTIVSQDQVPANSPMGMMLAALSQGADLSQIEKMMDLQERWERREAEKAFNDAMSAFKAEAVEIIKRREVDFTSQKGRTYYKHAELSDVVEVVGPPLSKHGFAWSWTMEQIDGQIKVTCILKHRAGHSDSVSLQAAPDNSGNKNSIQAIASTVTYLERHTLKAITGVSEKGDDKDGVVDNTPLADAWIARAKACVTAADLGEIWKEGLAEIQKTNDMSVYEKFKEAVSARGEDLKKTENTPTKE